MQEQELSDLPNDIIEIVRKTYFIKYIKPILKEQWAHVQGCKSDPSKSIAEDFISRTVSWTLQYLYTFWPSVMRHESPAYNEYLKTHKCCWVDMVGIKVDFGSDTSEEHINNVMTSLKLRFQQRIYSVQVRGRKIRLDMKSSYEDFIEYNLKVCDIDRNDFEWKRLILKIDIEKEIVYFEDPSDGKISKRVYTNNYGLDYSAVKDKIQWFVYLM